MARASSILAPRVAARRRTGGRASHVDPASHADLMPRHLAPMLALLAADIPRDRKNWAFEYKWDGVRALAYLDGANLTIESRNRLDITRRYPELLALGDALGRRTAVLDGEIVALDELDRPSFPRLQRRMHVNDPASIARLVRA